MTGVGPVLAIVLLASTPGAAGLGAAAASADKRAPAAQASGPLPSPAEIGRKWGIVTSTKRSPERNRAVGGAPNSFHLYGRAIDIARRPGVRHSEIEAAYRKAGFRLIESLDEGDHSHFAFALPGQKRPIDAPTPVRLASSEPETTCAAPAAATGLLNIRRRPDRTDGCPAPDEPAPKLRPLQPTQ